VDDRGRVQGLAVAEAPALVAGDPAQLGVEGREEAILGRRVAAPGGRDQLGDRLEECLPLDRLPGPGRESS
jgi:hypothetical protein